MLSTSKITLRAVEPDDLEFLYKCENDMPLWAYGINKEPISYFALKQYINSWNKGIYETNQVRLMIVFNENNATIGTVDLYDFDYFNSRVGVGIYIVKEYQNQGIGTETFQLLTEYAFNYLNIHQLYAFVSADNKNSSRCLVKAGFKLTATLKEWQKVVNNFSDVNIFTQINKL